MIYLCLDFLLLWLMAFIGTFFLLYLATQTEPEPPPEPRQP